MFKNKKKGLFLVETKLLDEILIKKKKQTLKVLYIYT